MSRFSRGPASSGNDFPAFSGHHSMHAYSSDGTMQEVDQQGSRRSNNNGSRLSSTSNGGRYYQPSAPFSSGEGSQSYYASVATGMPQSQPESIQDHHDHRYNRHREYSPKSSVFVHAHLQQNAMRGGVSDADQNFAMPAPEYRDREHRRMHHSDSMSSNISSSNNSATSGSIQIMPVTSPPAPNRGNGTLGMEAPQGRPLYSQKPNSFEGVSETRPSPSNIVDVGDDLQAQGGQQSLNDRKISCLECRSSKVKCSGQPEGGGGCDRCRRIKRHCIFEQHRRGRKPSHVKMHKLEQSVDTIMTALSALQEYKEKREALREMAEDLADEHGETKRRKRDESERNNRTASRSRPVKPRTESGHSLRSEQFSESPCSPKSASRSLVRGETSQENMTSNSAGANQQPDILTSRAEPTAPNAVDPTEGQELGLPPLSNPLKLLAQASDSALGQNSMDRIAPTPLIKEDEEYEEEELEPAGQRSARVNTTEGRSGGASRRGYWSLGLYSSRYDKGPAFDPVSCKLMTIDVARDLYGLYMRNLNARITLLDPILATFHYVRTHSALLLTSACALAARFASHIPNAEELANKLDSHIQEKLLPAILLQGYRSVEIAQAFIIMAAYHANTSSLDGDRSWSLLGYGIRIAAELDMNARMLSERQRFCKSAHTPLSSNQVDTPYSSKHGDEETSMSAEEGFQRKLRNRERTWCNLWLFEYSLSTHMGRRSTLGQDPVILGVSAGWHRAQYAIPGDEAIVAIINLRRLQIKNVEFFEHSVLNDVHKLPEAPSSASPSLRFQLEFYCNSCSADLNAWRTMYVEGEEGQSWRMKNARLYASYSRLILNSYALKSTMDQELLEPIYKESYNSALTYLTLFSERLDSPELVYYHNSAVVTVAYVAVFALRLCALDPKRYPYINSALVFDHVRALAKALARSGSVTPWRNGAASSYAPYLSAVLQRVESSITNNDSAYDPAASPSASPSVTNHTRAEQQASTRLKASSGSFNAPPSHTQPSTGVSTLAVDGANHVAGKDTSFSMEQDAFANPNTVPKLYQERLSFMAGPSGVQASTILDGLSSEDLQIGPSFFQDQIMEGSLFSDMSVFWGGQTSLGDQQYLWSTVNAGEKIL